MRTALSNHTAHKQDVGFVITDVYELCGSPSLGPADGSSLSPERCQGRGQYPCREAAAVGDREGFGATIPDKLYSEVGSQLRLRSVTDATNMCTCAIHLKSIRPEVSRDVLLLHPLVASSLFWGCVFLSCTRCHAPSSHFLCYSQNRFRILCETLRG